MGGNGQDAMNSIIAAADYLRRFRWVDATKMGLQGHSFGGYYTNYAITQSTRFAAAVASSGPTNIISEYGGLWGGGVSKKGFVENQQFRMNVSLWERPDLYIKNSPIFYADRVTTPLLMMANKRDANVSFAQGVEFFTALRRLGKRVWMLQYDEGDHGVFDDGKDRTDYLVRMTQFFDHYLKGAPPPEWMTQGVPARLKGIETGLELDEPGKTPGPGLLLPPRSPARGRGEGLRP
jgi:dipeptidyl aminopeptidase/acylaminoacyl peptidase